METKSDAGGKRRLRDLSEEEVTALLKSLDHPPPSSEPTLANTSGGIIFLPGAEAEGWFNTSGIPGTADEWAESVLIACGITRPEPSDKPVSI